MKLPQLKYVRLKKAHLIIVIKIKHQTYEATTLAEIPRYKLKLRITPLMVVTLLTALLLRIEVTYFPTIILPLLVLFANTLAPKRTVRLNFTFVSRVLGLPLSISRQALAALSKPYHVPNFLALYRTQSVRLSGAPNISKIDMEQHPML